MAMDEFTAIRAADRARLASEVLNNPLVMEALASMEGSLHKAWAASAPEDVEGRERIFQSLQHLRSFCGFFERLLRDGAVAARDLDALRKGRAA